MAKCGRGESNDGADQVESKAAPRLPPEPSPEGPKGEGEGDAPVATLMDVKEGVIVLEVRDELGADATIARGDIVEEVNGRAIEEWIYDTSLRVSASTDGARRRLALDLANGLDGCRMRYSRFAFRAVSHAARCRARFYSHRCVASG